MLRRRRAKVLPVTGRRKRAKAGTPAGFKAGLSGRRIRSGGRGRGMGRGKGRGPISPRPSWR